MSTVLKLFTSGYNLTNKAVKYRLTPMCKNIEN